jgi:hypothetical protein
MQISRLRLGIILLLSGIASIDAYLLIASTSVGQISELYGVGFCMIFLGALAIVGHYLGLAPDVDDSS